MNANQAAKPKFRIFEDRFKSCFDTGRFQISSRASRLFRNLPELLILKTTAFANNSNTEIIEFGPNVIYYVYVVYCGFESTQRRFTETQNSGGELVSKK